MEYVTDNEVTLANKLSINLSTVEWETVADISPPFPGYYVCQRLSDDHLPIRTENLVNSEAFPHVNSVSFMPHGSTVRMHPLEKPLRVLTCIFDKTFFESVTEINQKLWHEHSGAFMMIENKRLETTLQHIYTEMVQPGFGSELVIEGASNMILVEMARYGRQHLGITNSMAAYIKGGLAPWQLRRIQDRVEASLEMGYPNLSQLADLCGISQSHLMHTFKVSTGLQIHKYIAEERLKAAKQMLAEDQLSSTEISGRLGFCNPAYFATAFRRMTGKTPTEFQKLARTVDMSST